MRLKVAIVSITKFVVIIVETRFCAQRRPAAPKRQPPANKALRASKKQKLSNNQPTQPTAEKSTNDSDNDGNAPKGNDTIEEPKQEVVAPKTGDDEKQPSLGRVGDKQNDDPVPEQVVAPKTGDDEKQTALSKGKEKRVATSDTTETVDLTGDTVSKPAQG